MEKIKKHLTASNTDTTFIELAKQYVRGESILTPEQVKHLLDSMLLDRAIIEEKLIEIEREALLHLAALEQRAIKLEVMIRP